MTNKSLLAILDFMFIKIMNLAAENFFALKSSEIANDWLFRMSEEGWAMRMVNVEAIVFACDQTKNSVLRLQYRAESAMFDRERRLCLRKYQRRRLLL